MGLYHTEDQAMLKDTVAPFLAETAPVKHLRTLRDTNDQIGFARDLWKQFAEMGFTGILVPEADGGTRWNRLNSLPAWAMSKPGLCSKKLAAISPHRRS